MGEIRSIETEYNGYRFRSRLEARWAVFFDALGVDYEYEPEGFELPSGKRYLPDFRVRCYGTRGACREPQSMKDAGIYGLCAVCKYSPYHDMYSHQGDCQNTTLENDEYGGIDGVEIDGDANNMCTKCDGFKLDTGNPFDLYIEVKGRNRMKREDADKVIEFANLPEDEYDFDYGKTSNPVLVVGDIPHDGCSHDSFDTKSYEPMNGIDIYPFNYGTIDGDHFAAYPAVHNGCFYLWGDDSNYVNGCDVDTVERAYRIARQVRFEHGETPYAREIRGCACTKRS